MRKSITCNNYRGCSAIFFLMVAILLSNQANANCRDKTDGMGDISYSSNKAVSFGHWRTYVDSDPNMCWAISEPTSSEIILEKNNESNCRMDASLSFSYFLDDIAKGELMYFSGTVLDSNKPAYLYIDDHMFSLGTVEGPNAWAKNSVLDRDIFDAMSTAKLARIVSITDDGSVFSDTFKLDGFQNAANLANDFCQNLSGDL